MPNRTLVAERPIKKNITMAEDCKMSDLSADIAAYEAKRADLESEHMGKWVVVQNCTLVGIYDSFDSAAEEAVRKFGRGPYLIRQIGAPPISLPASVMYHTGHAPANQVWIHR